MMLAHTSDPRLGARSHVDFASAELEDLSLFMLSEQWEEEVGGFAFGDPPLSSHRVHPDIQSSFRDPAAYLHAPKNTPEDPDPCFSALLRTFSDQSLASDDTTSNHSTEGDSDESMRLCAPDSHRICLTAASTLESDGDASDRSSRARRLPLIPIVKSTKLVDARIHTYARMLPPSCEEYELFSMPMGLTSIQGPTASKDSNTVDPAQKKKRGRKRKDVPADERIELIRKRNREHARCTRKRKKEHQDALKQQIAALLAHQRRIEEELCYHTISSETPYSQSQRQTLLALLQMQLQGNTHVPSWLRFVTEDVNISFPALEPHNPSQHEGRSLATLIQECSRLSTVLSNLEMACQNRMVLLPTTQLEPVSFQFTVDPSDIAVSGGVGGAPSEGAVLVCFWSLSSRNLTRHNVHVNGRPMSELCVEGLTRLTFGAHGRVTRLQTSFDASGFVRTATALTARLCGYNSPDFSIGAALCQQECAVTLGTSHTWLPQNSQRTTRTRRSRKASTDTSSAPRSACSALSEACIVVGRYGFDQQAVPGLLVGQTASRQLQETSAAKPGNIFQANDGDTDVSSTDKGFSAFTMPEETMFYFARNPSLCLPLGEGLGPLSA